MEITNLLRIYNPLSDYEVGKTCYKNIITVKI